MTERTPAPQERHQLSEKRVREYLETLGDYGRKKDGDWIPTRESMRDLCTYALAHLTALRSEKQPTRDDVLEEAAARCDVMAQCRYEHARPPFELCAKNIRALKNAAPQEEAEGGNTNLRGQDPVGAAPKENADLVKRLRESADEVEEFPHPSHCDHLHAAFKVMREAADALSERNSE